MSKNFISIQMFMNRHKLSKHKITKFQFDKKKRKKKFSERNQ